MCLSAQPTLIHSREIAEKVLEGTGYNKILGAEDTAEADARLQNLPELLGSIEEYEAEAMAGDEPPSLAGYLERISLSAAHSIEDVDALLRALGKRETAGQL